MASSKSRVYITSAIVLIGVLWWHSRRPPNPEEVEKVVPIVQPKQLDTAIRPNTSLGPSSKSASSAQTQVVDSTESNKETNSGHQDAITPDVAGEEAFSTGDIAYQMFELKELSENKRPPGPNEARIFRGVIQDTVARQRYVEMRFKRGKWIVLVGEKKEELVAWPPRDLIPFRDQADLWTLYYENSQGLFLKHFPKVSIPELNGEFEVLSGWLATPTTLTHMALVGVSEEWPSESLISQLLPKRPHR